MTDQERAMRMAIEDIESLRRRNEVLQAKVDTMNLFATVLRTQPSYETMGMGEDSAWLLRKELEKLVAPADTTA